MRRILFFSHYNKYNNLADYVIYLLINIKHIYSKIVFISNSLLSDVQRNKLNGLCDVLIERENIGFDFGAWKDAIAHEGWEQIKIFDSLTLMNDTCFGPIYDLNAVYEQMEKKDLDFWGLTAYSGSNTDKTLEKISNPEHLQSYFLCFNNNVISSNTFQKFWNNVVYEEYVDNVIQKYEMELTSYLYKNGFKWRALYEQKETNDVTFFRPDLCIINSVPFIKIKTFLYFANVQFLIQLLQSTTKYPVSLIEDHFSELYGPATPVPLDYKLFNPDSFPLNEANNISKKIAIHLHIENNEYFGKCINTLAGIKFSFHLIITVFTKKEKAADIKYLKKHTSIRDYKVIILKENYLNYLPWLSLLEEYKKYDIVGHFTLRKLSDDNLNYVFYCHNELSFLLLSKSNEIISYLGSNEKVGIIIPDIEGIYKSDIVDIDNGNVLKIVMNYYWKKIGSKKDINFENLPSSRILSCQSFWFCTSALSNFIEKKIIIPRNTTKILRKTIRRYQALERLLPYIVWSEGYDFSICNFSSSQFYIIQNNYINNINKSITELKNSKDYRLGKKLLHIPRLIKRRYEKIFSKKG